MKTHSNHAAIDGRGVQPRISLGDVRDNKEVRFRLQEKYKGMCFLDKDPCDDNGHYTRGGDPLPPNRWEHRKFFGLIWQNRKGWFAETKLCSAPTGASENYFIDEILMRMIKDSPRNRSIRFRSDM